ncbi:MAG: nitronate monooxygenase [Rhodospirillales bacterium]|nr:nitronate monooxygenase [Rhodospirillales bacterium]
MDQVFRTRITELLGIRHPILAGGLMWLADARYVAAAVNAGAMGFITAKTFPDPERFRDELCLARQLTGNRPFGVNLYLALHGGDDAILERHTRILLDAGVSIVETAGRPPKALLPILKEAGCTVIHKVASLRHALSAQKLGVDAVTLVGAECGGHPGLEPVSTMVQTPLAARRLTLPFAVGGGIGCGAQLAAALAMGADAVTVGTRFTVAEEIWADRAYKERVLAAGSGGSRLVLQSLRSSMRVIDNQAARKVAALEARGVEDFEQLRPLAAGSEAYAAYESGDVERGLLSMGPAAAFAERVEPLGAIVTRMLEEAAMGAGRLQAVRT